MIKKPIILIVLIALSFATWGQSEHYIELKNHYKYWVFRNRLKTRFLSVGPNAGQSIPAGRLHNPIQNKAIDAIEPAMAEFGDATIYLGWYISVLATENFLLRMHNQNTADNEMELFYALNAINRLDYNSGVIYSYHTNLVNLNPLVINLPYYGVPASQILFNNFSSNIFYYPGNESKFYPADYNFNTEKWIPNPSWLNFYIYDGYFIRDDVPPYFENKLSNIIGAQSDVTRGVQYVGSYNPYTLSGIEYEPNLWKPYAGFYHHRAEESQDQLYSIMMGLRFVSHFIPSDKTVVYNGNTINLRTLNIQITKSITHYVKSKAWKIPNPHTNAMPSNGGGDMFLFAYGFATTANKILFNKNFYAGPWQVFLDNSPPSMHDFFSISYQSAILSLFPNYYTSFQDRVNEYLASTIGAISNCLRPSFPFNNNSVEVLLSRGIPYDWNIYALINHALFPTSNLTSNALIMGQMNDVKNDLNKCPCEAPYNFGPTQGDNNPNYEYPVEGWFASNKWQFKQSDYWNTDSDPYKHSTGRFNALDYMLYYNLYRILYSPLLITVPYQKIDKMEFNCQTTIPYTSNLYTSLFNSPIYTSGNNTNPIREYAISQIQSGATLLGQGNPTGAANVEYRAGDNIKLKNCFKVNRGAYFKAYIPKKLECDKFNYRSSLSDVNNEFAATNIKHFMDSIINENENLYAALDDSLSINRLHLSSNNGLSLYPNPSSDIINIEFTFVIQKIEIVNSKGQRIQSVNCSNADRHISINLNNRERGIYFAIIHIDSQKSETIKFILI